MQHRVDWFFTLSIFGECSVLTWFACVTHLCGYLIETTGHTMLQISFTKLIGSQEPIPGCNFHIIFSMTP